MANDIPTPLAQYQQADFNERLNLYLQYPALRSQFMAIDQDEVNNRIQLASASADDASDCVAEHIGGLCQATSGTR
jgi:hypothetical protein